MKSAFKRILALLLVLSAVLAFAACAVPFDIPDDDNTQPDIALLTQGPTADSRTVEPAQTQKAEHTENPTAAPTEEPTKAPTQVPFTEPPVSEDGIYDRKDDVALYLMLYGHLPSNYITKKKAQELGWTGGSLEPYAPGKCIGGDRFGNYERQLPTKKGRIYYECDIGTLGKSSRGAKRIVWSNDGLIYYTADHYEHFTLLYGGND